jgi:cysteine dioxygenase
MGGGGCGVSYDGAMAAAARTESGPCLEPPAVRFPKLSRLIGYLDSVRGRADLGVLAELLAETAISRQDILPACIFGTGGYRRNTISRTEHYELLALCWHSGHCTPIHDHRGSSCAFRVVEGLGTEVRFEMTAAGLVCPTVVHRMEPGYVCAAEDADIHQVANMQGPGEDLITLHIYSPPIGKMHTYEFATSKGAEGSGAYDC